MTENVVITVDEHMRKALDHSLNPEIRTWPLYFHIGVFVQRRIGIDPRYSWSGYNLLGGYQQQTSRATNLDEFGLYTPEESRQISYETLKLANSQIMASKEPSRLQSQNPRRIQYYF